MVVNPSGGATPRRSPLGWLQPPSLLTIKGNIGVLGALALAMVSDGIAFLSNTSSEIEAIIHFGLAAGIATTSSFLVLGLFVPLAAMRIDQLRGSRPVSASLTGRTVTLIGAANVTALSGASVLLLVVGFTIPGVAVLLATSVGFLVIPLLIFLRRNSGLEHQDDSLISPDDTQREDAKSSWLAPAVTGLARYRVLLLLVVVGVTATSVLFALSLDPEFDVKDFFDSDSDFVVGLDKLDEHISERGCEPAIIYIKGDLTDPDALMALAQYVSELVNNPYVGRKADNRPSIQDNLLSMLDRMTASPYALRLPLYSSSHPTGSHGWRNQFDLGNPDLYTTDCC